MVVTGLATTVAKEVAPEHAVVVMETAPLIVIGHALVDVLAPVPVDVIVNVGVVAPILIICNKTAN